MAQPLKILHFSDIHITAEVRQMKWHKWFSKRSIGALNLLRGRAKHFSRAEEKLQALVRFKEAHDIDIVINTGDYTALGLDEELRQARDFVAPLMHPPHNYITVPGNHDIYVHKHKSHASFFEYFAPVLTSDIPEYTQGGIWPQVRLIGADTAVVALNSARTNPLPWRSDGKIPAKELEAFTRMLQDERLRGRFIFVITHYAPRLANGQNDKKLHSLRNVEAFLHACAPIEYGAILCGHIHHTYRVFAEGIKSEIFCAGSATMERREGGWVYELSGNRLAATPIKWDGTNYYLASNQPQAAQAQSKASTHHN